VSTHAAGMVKQTRVKQRQARDELRGASGRSFEALHFLTGSRGLTTFKSAAPASHSNRFAKVATLDATKLKIANAKARHQRKKQRRYERRKAEWEAEQTGCSSGRRHAGNEEADDGSDKQCADSEDAESDYDSGRSKVEHFPNGALRNVPSKAMRRKAEKKAKKMVARGEASSVGEAKVELLKALSNAGSSSAAGTEEHPTRVIEPASRHPASVMEDHAERTLSMGVRVQDLCQGSGAMVQDRKQVKVSYVGRLTNGKVFDKSKGFSFHLGKGEVIKGWDIGVQGMRAGGKRRIIVPPKAGYGGNAAGDIPPWSTLIFDVAVPLR
jgi:FKBP-type peptidyl-prolyl cis-trans isomerase